MLPWRSLLFTAFVYLAIPLFPTQVEEDHRHTTFVFDRFNGSNLILEAEASVTHPISVLALTNNLCFMLGRALYPIPVQMKSSETLSSFSTTFVFSIVPPPSNSGGSGMAFFVTPHKSCTGALSSQYVGLLNFTRNGWPSNHLFAVEFDTCKDVEFNDPDGNHVGVDINSLDSVEARTVGYWNGEEFHGLSLKSRRNIQTWIDYDQSQSRLNIFFYNSH